MNVEDLQLHLTNLSNLLRDAGGSKTAKELDDFRQLLQPYRDKRLQDFVGMVEKAASVVAGAARPRAPKQSSGEIARVIANVNSLYGRAAQPDVSIETIEEAVRILDAANPPLANMKELARQIGIVTPFRTKKQYLSKIRLALIDRKSSAERAFA